MFSSHEGEYVFLGKKEVFPFEDSAQVGVKLQEISS